MKTICKKSLADSEKKDSKNKSPTFQVFEIELQITRRLITFVPQIYTQLLN